MLKVSESTIEVEFNELFSRHMRGGTANSFKRSNSTFYNQVLVPLSQRMYELGTTSVYSGERRKIFTIKAPCPLQEELSRLSQAMYEANSIDVEQIDSSSSIKVGFSQAVRRGYRGSFITDLDHADKVYDALTYQVELDHIGNGTHLKGWSLDEEESNLTKYTSGNLDKSFDFYVNESEGSKLKEVPSAVKALQILISEPSFKNCKIERLEDGSVLVVVNP